MRRRIIEAITYPRMLVMSESVTDDCPMHGYYNPADGICRNCEQREECIWLNSNDEFTALARKPMDVLLAAFQFGIDYVDAHVTKKNHNPRRCACESCTWVRDARRLAWEYEKSTARPAPKQ